MRAPQRCELMATLHLLRRVQNNSTKRNSSAMPSALYTLAYEDFQYYYSLYCQETGKRVPNNTREAWLATIGAAPSTKVDLHQLYELSVQQGGFDAATPREQWASLSGSLCGGALSGEQMRQLYSQHLLGFAEFMDALVQQYNRSTAGDQQQHRKKQQQQQQQYVEAEEEEQQAAPAPAVQQHAAAAPAAAAAAAAAAPGGGVRSRSRPPTGGSKQKGQALSAVDDPVPGNALASVVRWLREAATDLAGPAEQQGNTTARHKALAHRYSDFAQRMQAARCEPLPEELYSTFGVKPARRSGRVRSQPIVFQVAAAASEISESDSEDDVDPWAIQEGSQHQAAIPALRQLPTTGPTAGEVKFLSAPVYSPPSLQQQQQNPGLALPPGQFLAAYRAAGTGDGRRALIAQWVGNMDAQLGPQLVQKLGLGLLGAKLRAKWAPQEEILFALGMLERYRNFRHMHRTYLRRRSVHALNGYYYNCWKNNASQVPEDYEKICRNGPQLAAFRQALCMQLAKIWNTKTMGTMPSSAQLPPDVAAAAAANAPAPERRRCELLAAQCTAGTQLVETDAAAAPAAAAPAAAAPAAAPAAAAADASPISAIDIRIGQIMSVEKHPDADSLYVEQVDVGEPEPRTIVSGLVQFVPLDQMQSRKVVVLCNLKPRNMRGIKSHGMLLCASNDAHDAVEPLDPPAEAAVGERVWFGNERLQSAPAEANRVQKKKLWEAVQPDLKTGEDCTAAYKGAVMHTSAGPVTAKTLAKANIS
ncbi:hypothetical protein OEZ85_000334 [Tetradesmus obliquus]|uniref:tRNA-binding domain-containing protein n=1 Tax=Tetradesmus obliquus TaxID=3088 RepID=A0ABY8URS1_TETOB|nr:hypothetical protein OEZ85_000334 [Tetradesmus obliquus]